MTDTQKPINRTFNNLKTQDKKTNKGQTVQELSNRSAGIVVVRKNKHGEPLVLLMRAYSYWDFPKGKIEIGERVIDAAIRETAEEAGIKELNFVWGRDHTQTLPYGIIQKISYYFLAETPQSSITMALNPESGLPEHEEYRWLTFKEAHKIVVPRISEVLDWAQEKIHNLTPTYLKQISTRPVLSRDNRSNRVEKDSKTTRSVAKSTKTAPDTKKEKLNIEVKSTPNSPKTDAAPKLMPAHKPAVKATAYLSMKGKPDVSLTTMSVPKGGFAKNRSPAQNMSMVDAMRPANVPTKFKKTPVASLKRK